jgi:hypothetical protein
MLDNLLVTMEAVNVCSVLKLESRAGHVDSVQIQWNVDNFRYSETIMSYGNNMSYW